MIIYLYVKQHTITKLKYFGKTEQKDPFKYSGSGSYWNRHLKKHGKDHVKTLEVWGFDDQELCTEFALKFSQDNNIVESSEWSNLREENGLDGNPLGLKLSRETKEKISIKMTNRIMTEDHRNNIGNALKDRIMSDEWKEKLSVAKKGKPGPIKTRSHIEKIAEVNRGMKRSEECKNNISKSQQGLVWWTNGASRTRSIKCPGDTWVRGRKLNI